MAKLKKSDQKLLELHRSGTLNPNSAAISDALFREHPFFDPRDLLQVRYEMLRRFYQAQAAFEHAGLTGLMPRQRGPRQGHKLSAEVIEQVRQLKIASPGLTTTECLKAIKEKFGITVHRRSLERALRDKKKLH
jgi:hypothetical protein